MNITRSMMLAKDAGTFRQFYVTGKILHIKVFELYQIENSGKPFHGGGLNDL